MDATCRNTYVAYLKCQHVEFVEKLNKKLKYGNTDLEKCIMKNNVMGYLIKVLQRFNAYDFAYAGEFAFSLTDTSILAGEPVTITLTPSLSFVYTTQAGDSIEDVLNGLALLINADGTFTALVSGDNLYIYTDSTAETIKVITIVADSNLSITVTTGNDVEAIINTANNCISEEQFLTIKDVVCEKLKSDCN